MLQTVFLRTSFIGCIILLFSCSEMKHKDNVLKLPYYNTPEFTPQFITSAEEANQKINHTISSFSLTNQYGNNITQKDIEGKIHVADFIFTRCGSICPVMTKHMKLVQEAFKNNPNVVILSYSVTPWIDSVSRLKFYADNNAISSPNWHLLTGNKADIYTLARKSYFAEEDLGYSKDSTDFLHTEHMLLVDRSKRIRGIYNGTLLLDTEQLIRDIRTLLVENITN
jgi:protein SCO1